MLKLHTRGVELFFLPAYSVCSVNLEPQFSEGFKDVPPGYDVEIGGGFGVTHIVTGYVVEVVGECQGISKGVVAIKINRIAKTGGALPEAATGW